MVAYLRPSEVWEPLAKKRESESLFSELRGSDVLQQTTEGLKTEIQTFREG